MYMDQCALLKVYSSKSSVEVKFLVLSITQMVLLQCVYINLHMFAEKEHCLLDTSLFRTIESWYIVATAYTGWGMSHPTTPAFSVQPYKFT